MADLHTNYYDDILSASMNGKKKFRLTYRNGTTEEATIEDISEYDQYGSKFGAGDINKTNQAVNEKFDSDDVVDPKLATEEGFSADAKLTGDALSELNKNLGGLRFGVDGDGNGGYYKADDSFVPFKGNFKKFEFSYAGTGRSKISVDISSLPNYKSITLDDIFVGMTMVNADQKTGPNTIENISYNQSTGIVSFDSVYSSYRSLSGYVVVSA